MAVLPQIPRLLFIIILLLDGWFYIMFTVLHRSPQFPLKRIDWLSIICIIAATANFAIISASIPPSITGAGTFLYHVLHVCCFTTLQTNCGKISRGSWLASSCMPLSLGYKRGCVWNTIVLRQNIVHHAT